MHLSTTAQEYRLETETYLLTVSHRPPVATLTTRDGQQWGRLSLVASADRQDLRDESYAIEPVEPVVHDDRRVVLRVRQHSRAWDRKAVILTCTEDTVEVQVELRGTGMLDALSVFGGRAVLPTGASGTFRSGPLPPSIFDPTPTEPVQVVRPGTSAVALGMVGDAEPGRTNAIFSPPPLLVALGSHPASGPTDVPPGPWLAASVRARVGALTFTRMDYEPLDGGWLLRFDYEGRTSVDDRWASPVLVLRPAGSPMQAIQDYRADLVAHDCAPSGAPAQHARWWDRTIFCGWGAQCARAAQHGGHPADLAREDLYDAWLRRLERYGPAPGTVVIDDKWQRAYGSPEPDPDKWPDLAGWIAGRHRTGQRVLLWWRAWSPEGLPPEECITAPDGTPVAADPTSPAYQARLEATMERLLGPGGLDADGLKVDFTQRAPSGSCLQAHGDGWGIALLHGLLDRMYRAAKRAKPDALMVTHTPHPAFADVCDMVRLNDVLESDPHGNRVPVVDQLRFRHAVVTSTMPHHLVDTDQWPMPNRAEWMAYARAQSSLGVPALYYVESIDNSGEAISGDDLEQLAARWDLGGHRPGNP